MDLKKFFIFNLIKIMVISKNSILILWIYIIIYNLKLLFSAFIIIHSFLLFLLP